MPYLEGNLAVLARCKLAHSYGRSGREERALEKLAPLFSSLRTDVSGKLASQDTGFFFFCHNGDVTRVQSDRSFLRTEQLSEAEILELASRFKNQS